MVCCVLLTCLCIMFMIILACGCIVVVESVFFFKQKTAYEMRISDWSSDVCSSDLGLDIGEALRGEHHARILLAQRLEPFAKLRGERRTVEHEPAFVDDDQAGTPVKPALDPVKEIGEHGRSRGRTDEAFGLERSEEHTSELQSLMRISYAVFCLKKKTKNNQKDTHTSE